MSCSSTGRLQAGTYWHSRRYECVLRLLVPSSAAPIEVCMSSYPLHRGNRLCRMRTSRARTVTPSFRIPRCSHRGVQGGQPSTAWSSSRRVQWDLCSSWGDSRWFVWVDRSWACDSNRSSSWAQQACSYRSTQSCRNVINRARTSSAASCQYRTSQDPPTGFSSFACSSSSASWSCCFGLSHNPARKRSIDLSLSSTSRCSPPLSWIRSCGTHSSCSRSRSAG